MAVNTAALDDGQYVTMSSLSVVASQATVKAQDVTVTSTLSAVNVTITGTLTNYGTSETSYADIGIGSGTQANPSLNFNSEKSLGLYRSAASKVNIAGGELVVIDGLQGNPALAFKSETSLGVFRSGASTMALSFGQFRTGDGTAILPGLGFASETSLGLYRSAASNVLLSYGTLGAPTIAATSNLTAASAQVVGAMTLRDGAAITPSFAFASEASLGLFRSAASSVKASYGTFDLTGAWFKPSINTTAVTGLAQIPDGVLVVSPTGALTYSLAFKSGLTIFMFASTSTIVA